MAGVVVLRALRTLRPRALVLVPGESVLPPASCVSSPPWRSSAVRCLQLSSALSAGHNKWSKVKHIKGPKDDARAKAFMKMALMIKVAVKEGGPNPDMNVNLANLLEQCRGKNMPKASVEAAIKSADKAKPLSQYMMEARGPDGYLLLIEILTDSVNRCQQEVKRLILRNQAIMWEGARNNFMKRGVVMVPAQDISTERALELAIEAGAQDVQETEDEEEKPHLQFICDVADVMIVRSSLEKLGMKISSAGSEFVPRTFVSLDQDQMNAASTLIGILNDYPDVIRVWDNIQADS